MSSLVLIVSNVYREKGEEINRYFFLLKWEVINER